MSRDKSHNEELPMEDLFRDVFSDHREPVDEKDFDQFMGQLEDTGFFDKNRRRPFFIFLFVCTLLGGTILYYIQHSNKSSSDKQLFLTEPNIPVQNLKPAKDSVNKAVYDTIVDKAGLPIVNSYSKEEIKILPNSEAKAQVNPPIEDKSLLKEDLKPVIKDSVPSNPPAVVKRNPKDSVRIKYVIRIDTIKTVDSLNIKKRKWERMKGKNK